MQKLIVFCAAVLTLNMTASAQTFFTRDGKIKFDATAPASPDDISAYTNKATCVLDVATGGMVWKVLVKGFIFDKSLMQEHFNENYMESDKFPDAMFNGKITNLSEVNFSKDGAYNAVVSGKMTIHGVQQDVTTNGALTVSGKTVRINAGFNIKLADYGVKIPAVVSANIAKEAKILIDASLAPK